MELKGKIRVTDALLKELFSRQILMQQNVDDIKVSPYVVETNVLLKLSWTSNNAKGVYSITKLYHLMGNQCVSDLVIYLAVGWHYFPPGL